MLWQAFPDELQVPVGALDCKAVKFKESCLLSEFPLRPCRRVLVPSLREAKPSEGHSG